MGALGWFSFGRQQSNGFRRKRAPRSGAARKTAPRLERLEDIALLATSNAILTITEPALVLSNSLTNFGFQSSSPARALAPSLPLFNPQLGTLVDVRLTATTNLTSIIRSQNLSPVAGADITASVSGQTQLDFSAPNSPVPPIVASLTQTGGPVHVDAYVPNAPINFAPPSGVSFDGVQHPALAVSNTQTFTYQDPATLAFLTASARRSTVPVTLSASAMATASAVNGNLTTVAQTPASATVTVSYDYTAPCPLPTGVVRFGIHHQQTQIVVNLNGPATPADANNPNNYTIIAAGSNGRFDAPDIIRIPVKSATYNARNNTVTLIPVQRLNVHYKFELSINYPCYNGTPATVVFGTKFGLGGFTGHHKNFIPVVGGHIVR